MITVLCKLRKLAPSTPRKIKNKSIYILRKVIKKVFMLAFSLYTLQKIKKLFQGVCLLIMYIRKRFK